MCLLLIFICREIKDTSKNNPFPPKAHSQCYKNTPQLTAWASLESNNDSFFFSCVSEFRKAELSEQMDLIPLEWFNEINFYGVFWVIFPPPK